jgi:hypothetical protein
MFPPLGKVDQGGFPSLSFSLYERDKLHQQVSLSLSSKKITVIVNKTLSHLAAAFIL